MGAVNSTEAQHAVATRNNMSIEAVLAAPPNASTVMSPLCSKYTEDLAKKPASSVHLIQGATAFAIIVICLLAADSIYHAYRYFSRSPRQARHARLIDGICNLLWVFALCGCDVFFLLYFQEAYAHRFYCEAMPDWSSYSRQTGFWIAMIVFGTPVMWALVWIIEMALVLGFLTLFSTPDALDSR